MRRAILLFVLLLGLVPARLASADPYIQLSMTADGAMTYTAADGVGPDTPFAIASVGKLMTAVAVLRLVERGILDLDDRVAEVLPADLSDLLAPFEDRNLSHLLTMTSGLPDYYDDAWFEAALAEGGAAQNAASVLRAIADEPELFAAGDRFDYSNTNYVLLGAVLEEATGESYAEVLQSEVFDRAGMTDSFVFGSRPLPPTFAEGHDDRASVRRFYSGHGLGDGGVIASSRDVARFYRALFVTRQLLTDGMLRVMLRDPAGHGYGMGVEVEDGIAGHSGGDFGYASDVRIDLESHEIAVEMIADEEAEALWPLERLSDR
jgi:D-alanyl-D-alanine carboxypeptidase